MKFNDFAVIIPAYNAGDTLRELIDQLSKIGFERKDIVIINDGSRDRTRQIAIEEKVTLYEHEENMGKGMALRSGIKIARGMNKKRIITLDADGQHDPDEIDRFMAHIDEYDLIIGERADRLNMPVLRRLVNRTTSLVVSLLSGKHIPDVQCGFRMIALHLFKYLTLRTRNYQTESELIIKAVRKGLRIGSVSVSTHYKNEKSHIKPFIDTIRFVIMAMRFLWV